MTVKLARTTGLAPRERETGAENGRRLSKHFSREVSFQIAAEMTMSTIMSSNRRIVFTLAVIAAIVAVIRYFLKGLLAPLGVPTVVGSLLASITIVLLVGLLLIFVREGRSKTGSYLKAAVWFAVLAVWCELLVIAGILITERHAATTYYQGPWRVVEEMYSSPGEHAIRHTQGFFVRLAVYLILGGIVFALTKRGRTKTEGVNEKDRL